MNRPEKSIRLKITGEDVAKFEAAKTRTEDAVGIKMTDVDFARSVLKHHISKNAK